MSFTNTDPCNHQSESTWFTPQFFKGLGPFDLDPCTVSYRPFDMAYRNIDYDKGQCGLKVQWIGDVWLNPPYGKEIKPFIDKFIGHKKGLLLIFARMDTQPIHDLINSGANFYFLRKRVSFISRDFSKKTNAGTPSCLIFYDLKYYNRLTRLVSTGTDKLDGIIMQKQIN